MFQFYIEEYHGTITEQNVFERLRIEAEAYVDALIANPENLQYKQIDRKRRLAVCAAVDCLYSAERAKEDSKVASESVGDHSISYRDLRSSSSDLKAKINSKIMMYLAGTGLCYSAMR